MDISKDLNSYFESKLNSYEDGVIGIIGERNINNNLSIEGLFNELKLLVSEIDLAAYNLNFGVDRFVIDLKDILDKNTDVIVFKNFELANRNIISIVEKLYPNKVFNMQDNKIKCNKKFIVYIYNSDEDGIHDKGIISSIDRIFFSKTLTLEDSEILLEKEAIDEVMRIDKDIAPTIKEARNKLESIIGVQALKDFITNVDNNYKVQQIRKKLGLTTSKISMNMIFTGNAGTGKTNAARITFEYLKALGILQKDIFKEVSKADFVAENNSDIANKVMEIVYSAIGGILFIDEAYSLCESENDKDGKEIIDALLKGIEDNRDNLIVILAGYENDMDKLLSYNQGLKSRFPNIIKFDDYTSDEMYKIAVDIAKSKGYRIANDVKPYLIDLFDRNHLTGKNDLGNGRFVRNIVEKAILDGSKKYLNNNERSIDLLEKDNFNFKVNTKFNIDEKLTSIIGLEEVKDLLRNQYKLIIAQEKRRLVGVKTEIKQNLNMVFVGNPGTGKTSIARLVAEMLNSMGLLKIGQLIETDRSNFVSEVPGETAKKTEMKFKEAIGGVLFIDEAYTLAKDEIGREAIETLLKLIEDYSDDVVVILAGYKKEMENFFDVNIGLKSRFPVWTNFQDYNPEELLQMAIVLLEGKGFRLDIGAQDKLKEYFQCIYNKSDEQSGNGRMVRNSIENLIRNQSIRIAENSTSVYSMNLINRDDVESLEIKEINSNVNIEEILDEYIGNCKTKEFIRNENNLIKIREKRRELGIGSEISEYMNIVFLGSEGTDKKEFMELLANLYWSNKIIENKSILEISSSDIIAQFNKDTSIEEILSSKSRGIICINEFHLLRNENEIINQLITLMNNLGNKVIFIAVGEDVKIKEIILQNEGLNYRFPKWIELDNYSNKELYNSAVSLISKRGFEITDIGKNELRKAVSGINKSKDVGLRNDLLIKQYINLLLNTQSLRVINEDIESLNINTIEKIDVINSKNNFIEINTI